MTASLAGQLAAVAALLLVGWLIVTRRRAARHGRRLVSECAAHEHPEATEGPREALRRLIERVNDELDPSSRHASMAQRQRPRRQVTAPRLARTPLDQTSEAMSLSSWPPLPPQRRPGTNPSTTAPRRSPRV